MTSSASAMASSRASRPTVRVIDVTHGVAAPRRAQRGASSCGARCPFCPAGVHLAVVDPGVGGTRRAVAVRCAEEGRVLVGPDNGVLSPAAERFGGIVEAVDVGALAAPARACRRRRSTGATSSPPWRRTSRPASRSAPPASRSTPDELVQLDAPHAPRDAERVSRTSLSADTLRQRRRSTSSTTSWHGGRAAARPAVARSNGTARDYARTFDDVGPGELLLYEDAYRDARAGVNRGSARRVARPGARRRGPDRAVTPRPPAAAPARDRTRRTTARASSPRRARRTARSSPPRRSRPAAAARGARGRAPAGQALLMSLVLRDAHRAAAARRRRGRRRGGRGRGADQVAQRRARRAAARSRGSWPRAARRRAGRCSASA